MVLLHMNTSSNSLVSSQVPSDQASRFLSLHATQTTEVELIHEVYFLLKGLPSSMIDRVHSALRLVKPIYLSHVSQGTLLAILHPILARVEKFNALRQFCRETTTLFPNWMANTCVFSLPSATPSFIALSFSWALSIILTEYEQHLDRIYASLFAMPTHSPTSTSSALEIKEGPTPRKATLLRVLPLLRDPFLERFVFPASDVPLLDHLYELIPADAKYLRCFLLSAAGLFKIIERYISQGECHVEFFIQSFSSTSDKTALSLSAWQSHQTVANVPLFLQPHIKILLTLGESAAFLRHQRQAHPGISTAHRGDPSRHLPPYAFLSHVHASLQRDLQLPATFPTEPSTFSPFLPFDPRWVLQRALVEALRECPSARHLVTYVKSECALIPSLEELLHLYLFLREATVLCDPLFDWIYVEKKEWKDMDFLGPLCWDWFQSCAPTLQHLLAVHLVKVPGFEAFQVTFQVEWPLNAIITPSQITLYSKWLSTLLQLKQAQYLLLRKTWRRKQSSRAYDALRHRFIQYVNAISFFWFTTVIAKERRELFRSIESATSFEQLVGLHAQFLQRILQLGLLETSPVFKAILSLFHSAVEFSFLVPTDLENIRKLNEDVEKVVAFILRALNAISATTSHVNTLILSLSSD